MTYNLSTVRICQGDNGLYQFDGIQALEVYNRAEGYVKFCGSAGTRKFPGLGRCGDQAVDRCGDQEVSWTR